MARPEREKRSRLEAQRCSVLRVTRRFGAPSARVFNAWLDPEVAGRWLFATASRSMAHVEIDARIEGSFCFVDRRDRVITEYTGEYIEIVPHRRLVFTLSMEKHPNAITRVMIEIAPLKKGCELKLTHENVPQDCASYIEGRWTGILYGLGVTLDSASAAFHHDQE
ncbi:MAG TPA: SRPBCC domain-containing protein [Casimicrobiaceae bacterium]|nr:SRPBCC domain-containing protein [Casimicrobiaceae bacterium]